MSGLRTVLFALTLVGAVLCWATALISGLMSCPPYLAWRQALKKRGDTLPLPLIFTVGQARANMRFAAAFLGRTQDPDPLVEHRRQESRARLILAGKAGLGFVGFAIVGALVEAL